MARKIILLALCAIPVLAGLSIALLGVIGVLDPVGFQQAADHDPFGPPPPRWEFVVTTFVGLGVAGAGMAVAWKVIKSRDPAA